MTLGSQADSSAEDVSGAGDRARLAELVAALSLATDLGLGQPQEQISFGGVASFIFADLIVLPVLNIYPQVLRDAHDAVRRRLRRRDRLRRPWPHANGAARQEGGRDGAWLWSIGP